jgi:hypothetical protein
MLKFFVKGVTLFAVEPEQREKVNAATRALKATKLDIGEATPRLVGEDIPLMNLYTVKLEMNEVERRRHDQMATPFWRELYVGSTDMIEPPTQKVEGHFAAANSDEPEGILDLGMI